MKKTTNLGIMIDHTGAKEINFAGVLVTTLKRENDMITFKSEGSPIREVPVKPLWLHTLYSRKDK